MRTPNGVAEKASLTGRFFQRKLKEYEEMRAEIESLRSEVSEVSRLKIIIILWRAEYDLNISKVV